MAEKNVLRSSRGNLFRACYRPFQKYFKGKYGEAYLFRQREMQIADRVGTGGVSTYVGMLGAFTVAMFAGGAFPGGVAAMMLGGLAIRATKDYGVDRAARKAGTVADVAMEKAQ